MSEYHIVVCGSVVPDPLQTLEPVISSSGPSLKNELMLPHVLDPWAGHALYEANNLAKSYPGSKVWLASIAPKAKLQQVMMTMAQKVPFQLIAIDAPSSGFSDSHEVANLLANAIRDIQDLDMNKLLLFGGWESASRANGSTMQILGELLGIQDQFQGVDEIKFNSENQMEIMERVEGGKHQVSICDSPPAVFGWATGNLAEPPNNPQVGMQNMRTVMPNLQKSPKVLLKTEGLAFSAVELPQQKRETRIEKNKSTDEIAKEIVEWINQD